MRTILTSPLNILKRNILIPKRNLNFNTTIKNRPIGYFYSVQKTTKASFKFSSEKENMFLKLFGNKDIAQKIFETAIKNSDRDLEEIQRLNGQASIDYVKKLFQSALKLSTMNIANKDHKINKKAQEYFLKVWNILQENPQITQSQFIKNSESFFLFQYLIGRFFYRVQKRQEAMYWLELFRQKIEKPTTAKLLDALNSIKFYTYTTLTQLYQLSKNHQKARQYYNKFKDLADLPNLKVSNLHNLFAFRDYAFNEQNYGDKKEAIKAIQHMSDIANYKLREEAEVAYTASSIFQMVGQPQLGIDYLQKIQTKIQQAGDDSSSNDIYTSCLLFHSTLCEKYKFYERQYNSLRKLVFLYKVSTTHEIRDLLLSNYLFKLAEVEIKLGKINQSYQTLKEADEITKNISKFPQGYNRQSFEMIRKSLQNTIVENKLQIKYLQILQKITNQIRKAEELRVNIKQ